MSKIFQTRIKWIPLILTMCLIASSCISWGQENKSLKRVLNKVIDSANQGNSQGLSDQYVPYDQSKKILKYPDNFDLEKYEFHKKSLVSSLTLPSDVKIVGGKITSINTLTPENSALNRNIEFATASIQVLQRGKVNTPPMPLFFMKVDGQWWWSYK